MNGDLLHNLSLFVDGYSFAGKIEEFQPPKIGPKMEEIIAGGMAGPVKVPLASAELLECEFTLIDFSAEILKALRFIPGKSQSLMARGAMTDREGTTKPIVIEMRGNIEENDDGNWKPGSVAKKKVKMTLDYYKAVSDGQELCEIDPVNGILSVNGVDQFAAVRAALGI